MNYEGKKVVVMGLGLHGGGLPVAKWFFSQGAEVIVTDLKKKEDLLPTIELLDAYCRTYRLKHSARRFISIEYVLGGHREKDFSSAQLVVQNPAVPRESPFLNIARESGVPVENETSLFFSLTPAIPKIGITGTRGKSTTATLIYEMVRNAYVNAQVTSVALPTGSKGGFEVLDTILAASHRDSNTPVVMELSSWQLEGLAPHHISPHIAVLTNISPDHLNRYENMEEYIEAKRTIYRYQGENDSAIYNFDNPITRVCGNETQSGKRYWFSLCTDAIDRGAYIGHSAQSPDTEAVWMRDDDGNHEVCLVSEIKIQGEHNKANVLAAVCAAWVYGIRVEDIRKGIAVVHGIPSRLEYLGSANGRRFYNDTAATSPEGTRAALATLFPNKNGRIILIGGGSDKGLDFTQLAPLLRDAVSHLILFTGTASPKIVSVLGSGFGGTVDMVQTMQEAVDKAWHHSQEGDIILLSPAAASFGLFINEFDRGRQFEKAFLRLQET